MKTIHLSIYTLLVILIFSACSSNSTNEQIEEETQEINPNTFVISVNETSFDFGDISTDSNATKNFTVTNTGTGLITINDITSTSNYTVSPRNTTIEAGTNKTFTITFSPSAIQNYSQSISISSNATTNPGVLSLKGHGIDPFYLSTISPIIAQNCSTSGCHDAASKAAGVVMSNFLENKKAFITDKAWDEINSGSMPKGGSLTQTQKDNLLKWIESDYTNGIKTEEVATTYAKNIAPLINQSCATTNCHGGRQAPTLTNYSQVKTAFEATGANSSIDRIEIGNMPKNRTRFDQTKIDLIKSWINGGFVQ